MKTFTVIGYYDDTGQAFSMPAKGADAYAAMQSVAKSAEYPDLLCIVGAIAGRRALITPGCDNGLTAFAVDLKGE